MRILAAHDQKSGQPPAPKIQLKTGFGPDEIRLVTIDIAAAGLDLTQRDLAQRNIPPGAEIYYVSGIVPSIIDTDADPNSRAAYGDTRQQTISVLTRMKETMEAEGWSLGDIVMMRVYLVGDEATGGRLDFAGFMAGYSEFFATPEQPNKPARAVMQVAELIRPGWRVEIEAQAARVPETE